MKIYTKCLNCQTEVHFWTWESEKVGLKFAKGDKIELTCKKCNHKDKYSINDLKAKESKLSYFVSLLIFTIGTPLVFLFLKDYLFRTGIYTVVVVSSLLLVPGIIFSIITKNDRQRVRNFNRS